MKTSSHPMILASLLLLIALPSGAQTPNSDEPPTYNLPNAYIDVEYRQNIVKVIETLKEKKQTLRSMSDNPDFRWKVVGDTPKGLRIDDDGVIYGKPEVEAEKTHRIAVEISDVSLPRAKPHKMYLTLTVATPSVSLKSIEEAQTSDAPVESETRVADVQPPPVNEEAHKALVAALIKIVSEDTKDTNENAQAYAAEQLGSAGVRAVDAIAHLVKLSKSEKSKINLPATTALARILTAGGIGTSTSIKGTVKDESDAPVPHAEVAIVDAKENHIATTKTNANGEYDVSSLSPGRYRVSVKHDGFTSVAPRLLDLEAGDQETINLPLESTRRVTGGQFSRTIIGFEQSGASASNSRRNFFLDLSVSIPFPVEQRVDRDFGPRTRLWGNSRITSVPNPNFDKETVAQFATAFNTRVADTKVSEVVQAAEFVFGVEHRLSGTRRMLPSFAPETKQKFSLNLIAGAGVITPLTPGETSVNNIFAVSTEAVNRYPQLAGKDNVAFVSPDRDRFFRQYYAGLRFKTFYFDNGERPLNRFPGTLDLTFGQNEAITGGRLRGGIMRIEGFFPLPYQKLSYLFLFGTAQVKLARTNIADPLILKPLDSDSSMPNVNMLFSPNTGIITVPQINRDYYRLGVGVDALQLLRTIFDAKPSLTKPSLTIPSLNDGKN